MLYIILRKMFHNGWLLVCLILSSVIAVAMITSIPLYANGILQKLLIKDIETLSASSYLYPGRCLAKVNMGVINDPALIPDVYAFLDSEMNTFFSHFGVPALTNTRKLTADYFSFMREGEVQDDNNKKYVMIEGYDGIEDHIRLVYGRMPESEPVDGIFEVMVTEEGMKYLNLVLDAVYDIYGMTMAKARVVGVFQASETDDPFWYTHIGNLKMSFIGDFDLLSEVFLATASPHLTVCEWYYALDYRKISIETLPRTITYLERYKAQAAEYRVSFDIPLFDKIKQYAENSVALKRILWFLMIPILIMLALFIYMISQLTVENDKDEIAVLKSRGGSKASIFLIYLIESVIISLFALVIGPVIGVYLCLVIGSSNGFMEFVNRAGLPVSFSSEDFLYAVTGALFFMVTMLVPVVLSSRVTIVEHKKKKARSRDSVFWKRYFVDLILIAISLYGLYTYYSQQKVLAITKATASDLPVDPLLFLVSVIFIFGVGLLVLRIYPSVIRFFYWLFKDRMSPVTYASFIQVGRSMGHEQFLMIFLILSLSIGIYNSTTARTINTNIEEKARYALGADITIEPIWAQDYSGVDMTDAYYDILEQGGLVPGATWIEPKTSVFRELEGVSHAARVYTKKRVSLRTKSSSWIYPDIMGIDPADFGETAWFQPSLLPTHWYNYLNLLIEYKSGVILSSNLRDQYNIGIGDLVTLSISNQPETECIVAAFVDYWPTYNPHSSDASKSGLVIANLGYLHEVMTMEPYDIWLEIEPGVTYRNILDAIDEEGLLIEASESANQVLITRKNDPTLQGTNGSLTLGFLITMSISLIGFIIYWFLSLKSRTLQFGIFRAMGLSKGKLMAILLWEQILISGAAIVFGIGIGNLTSRIFTPLLQLTYSATDQVPPFRVVSLRSDYLQIYAVALLMIAVGTVLFRWIISRIKIHQALKLGED